MKFKFLLVLLFSYSCIAPQTYKNKSPYTGSGFAYIYNSKDYEKKIISNKFDESKKIVSHNTLVSGTQVKIINPVNKKSVFLKTTKKTKFPILYKVLITKNISEELELDKDFPFVEIQEFKKNKSFVVQKAVTFNEEKQVHGKSPVVKIVIDNISHNTNRKTLKKKDFSIIIAEFYSIESAKVLKANMVKNSPNLNHSLIKINKKNKNNYELFMGPYSTIKTLKNDYIALNELGFEEIDIKINK